MYHLIINTNGWRDDYDKEMLVATSLLRGDTWRLDPRTQRYVNLSEARRNDAI